jgi:putative transposase
MHWRKTIRLAKHDYTRRGYYFLTFNTKHRRELLSRVEDGAVSLTELGERCVELLKALPDTFLEMRIDAYVLMPDHVHMLIEVGPGAERGVSELLRWFKGMSAKHHLASGGEGALWQRGSFDVVVPDDEALARIREYIRLNPARWQARSGV